MKRVKKALVYIVKLTDLGSAVAVRLTMLTGKSKTPIHPKHLTNPQPWFLKYIRNNDIVLDLGSGNGQNSLKVAKIAKKVVGLEIDQDLINLSETSAQNTGSKNTSFLKGDLEKTLPFKNSNFDAIIFLDVLEHINRRDQILNEARRVLKKNGVVLIGVPNSQTSWKKYQRSAGICSYSDPDHKIEYSETAIKKLITRHKFKIIEFNYGKYDIPLKGIIDIVGALSLRFYKSVSNYRQKMAERYPQEASGFEIVAKK